jgi:dTMP kinase
VARWATGDLRPHLTVLLDLPPQQGLTRFEERDRIEAESLEFHERVREMFLRLANAAPEHYLVVDARLPVEEITTRIQARLRPLLGQARREAPEVDPAPTLLDDAHPTETTATRGRES